MSEEPPTLVVDEEDLPVQQGQDLYTLLDFQKDMVKWPPELQEHARRFLTANGIAAYDVEVAPTVVEAISSIPEVIRSTSEERKAAYEFGETHVHELVKDDRFLNRCTAAGVEAYDDVDPRYWQVLANFAEERVALIRKKSIENGGTGESLKLRALELMATSPSFVLASAEMSKGRLADRQRAAENMDTISKFNHMIADVVEVYPDLKAAGLKLALLNVVNTTLVDGELHQFANRQIEETIVGMQFETAYGDILQAAGIDYRRATPSEDWKEGFDYILDEKKESEMRIDVKTSLKEVDPQEGRRTVVRQSDGTYRAYSMIHRDELRGGFHLDKRAAAYKAEVLLKHLEDARNGVMTTSHVSSK